jgi:hypothetical protein
MWENCMTLKPVANDFERYAVKIRNIYSNLVADMNGEISATSNTRIIQNAPNNSENQVFIIQGAGHMAHIETKIEVMKILKLLFILS